ALIGLLRSGGASKSREQSLLVAFVELVLAFHGYRFAMFGRSQRRIDHFPANVQVRQAGGSCPCFGNQSPAPPGGLVRRYLYDHLPLGDLVAFLHQNVSNGHVVFGGDNGWLSKDQTLSTQIDVCAQENIEHPDTESDKRQEVGPFDRHALHDSPPL